MSLPSLPVESPATRHPKARWGGEGEGPCWHFRVLPSPAPAVGSGSLARRLPLSCAGATWTPFIRKPCFCFPIHLLLLGEARHLGSRPGSVAPSLALWANGPHGVFVFIFKITMAPDFCASQMCCRDKSRTYVFHYLRKRGFNKSKTFHQVPTSYCWRLPPWIFKPRSSMTITILGSCLERKIKAVISFFGKKWHNVTRLIKA